MLSCINCVADHSKHMPETRPGLACAGRCRCGRPSCRQVVHQQSLAVLGQLALVTLPEAAWLGAGTHAGGWEQVAAPA